MQKLTICFLLNFLCFSLYAQNAPSPITEDEQPPSSWSTYLEQTETETTPSKSLVHAIELFERENIYTGYAIDLGAGTGKDTLYLLKHHWKVLALDYSPDAINIILKRANAAHLVTPDTQVSDFQTMQLPNDINLVNANLSLPFVPEQVFPSVWQDVVEHIRVGGRFSGSFLGEQDGFAGSEDKQMTFITPTQLQTMLKDFKIETLTTRQGFYAKADGETKYWQIWDVVAKKVKNDDSINSENVDLKTPQQYINTVS